ncbi:MAG: SdpI family protein [Ruminococcus sp.]|nr:SdpI family protein [Ruminococcus sp.]
MNKQNNISVMIVTFVMFLSAIVSLFYLPEEIAVQWNENGVSNTASKFLILIFPVLSAVFIVIYNKNSNENTKKSDFIRLTVSLVLFAVQGIIIFNALEYINMLYVNCQFIQTISLLITGLIICVCGNYMPKFISNYYCGIKVSYAYDNSDLWTKIQRFSGKLWFISGLVIMILSFVQYKEISLIVLCIIFCMIIIPRIYGINQYSKNKE